MSPTIATGTAGRIHEVAQFSDLARPILVAISKLGGDDDREVEDDQILAALREEGYEPSRAAFVGTLRSLIDDGYITGYFTGGVTVTLIRLDTNGRREVEGWPASPGSLSIGDVEQLLAALRSRADDPALPEADRTKARAAADALKDLGVQVTATVIGAWLKSLGVG